MLPNILQRTGQLPRTKNCLAQNVASAKLESSWGNLLWQQHCWCSVPWNQRGKRMILTKSCIFYPPHWGSLQKKEGEFSGNYRGNEVTVFTQQSKNKGVTWLKWQTRQENKFKRTVQRPETLANNPDMFKAMCKLKSTLNNDLCKNSSEALGNRFWLISQGFQGDGNCI